MGSQMFTLIVFVGGIASLLGIVRMFFSPMGVISKLICNTFMGFVWLSIFNSMGSFLGFTIGFNLVNSAIVGIFGLPGFVFLLLSRYVLM